MYRDQISLYQIQDHKADIFISAFNSSERVQEVFNKFNTNVRKLWLILPDYAYTSQEIPKKDCFTSLGNEEIWKYMKRLLDAININPKIKLCIDITGFIKPYMMVLIAALVKFRGIRKIDIIYTEPQKYTKKNYTTFSNTDFTHIKCIDLCEGTGHSKGAKNDGLIIGSGYDHSLVKRIAMHKEKSKKFQIFGFPSLKLDMYQENILRAHKTQESVGSLPKISHTNNYVAAANDPFATASIINEIVTSHSDIESWYLSPLATKPQSLGFILYYLNQCINKPFSIIYPFTKTHNKKTSEEINRIWKYTIEFPIF